MCIKCWIRYWTPPKSTAPLATAYKCRKTCIRARPRECIIYIPIMVIQKRPVIFPKSWCSHQRAVSIRKIKIGLLGFLCDQQEWRRLRATCIGWHFHLSLALLGGLKGRRASRGGWITICIAAYATGRWTRSPRVKVYSLLSAFFLNSNKWHCQRQNT